MGYNDTTLPPERTNFWGGRIIPTNGVKTTEWWPTKDEAKLVEKVVLSSQYKNSIKETFGESKAEQICENFDCYAVFRWFTENFTKAEYTNDYRIAVNKEMVLKGLKQFQINVITPWVLNNS